MGELVPSLVSPVVTVVFVLVVGIVLFRKRRGHRSRMSVGSGAAGALYDLLDQDRRRAVEVIVEERAGEVDPERATDRVDD